MYHFTVNISLVLFITYKILIQISVSVQDLCRDKCNFNSALIMCKHQSFIQWKPIDNNISSSKDVDRYIKALK